MFENFNERARRALFFSRYEAARLGSTVIDTDHMLLGVLREKDPLVREILEHLRVQPDTLRSACPVADPASEVTSSAELPLSDSAKKALAYSSHVSEELKTGEVGPIHLLLGILRSGGPAGAILESHGLTFYAVLEAGRPFIDRAARAQKAVTGAVVVLRGSHDKLLDEITTHIALPREPAISRNDVALAIMDAIAKTGLGHEEFESLEALRNALIHALQERWPRRM